MGRHGISIRNRLSGGIFGAVALALAGFIAATPANAGGGAESSAPVVTSSEILDAAKLNQRIQAMAGPDKALTRVAVALAHHLAGGSAETPRVSIDQKTEDLETFDRLIVTVVRDGFLDDSVRGDWHRFLMVRGVDGMWSVAEARRAVRCYRPAGLNYRAGRCS